MKAYKEESLVIQCMLNNMMNVFSSVTSAEVSDIQATVQEKRFPCEFCGRTFTLNTEWERHVLRHGM